MVYQSKKIKCYNCAGVQPVEENRMIMYCTYCNAQINLQEYYEEEWKCLEQAAQCRNAEEFDEASITCEMYLKKNPNSCAVRWEQLLSRYRVVYIEKEDGTGKYCISCRDSVNSEILDDYELRYICEKASPEEVRQYMKDASYISNIQKKIKEGASDKYDIFICYKETDFRGGRTIDSRIAETIYNLLRHRGYKVFYARETMKNKAGADYEAAIYNAINTAQIMLVLALDKTYLETKWVKDECKRFIHAMNHDKLKTLFPLSKNLRKSELPENIQMYQAIDITNGPVDGYNNLLLNVEGKLGKSIEKNNETHDNPLHESVEEGLIFYAEEQYINARECFEVAANSGNLDALYHLGCMYYQMGFDGASEPDYKGAFNYFKKAADSGHVEAMYRVGFAYEIGIGVERNKESAKYWYESARKNGHLYAPSL